MYITAYVILLDEIEKNGKTKEIIGLSKELSKAVRGKAYYYAVKKAEKLRNWKHSFAAAPVSAQNPISFLLKNRVFSFFFFLFRSCLRLNELPLSSRDRQRRRRDDDPPYFRPSEQLETGNEFGLFLDTRFHIQRIHCSCI